MLAVSPFEVRLLTITRALFAPELADEAIPLLSKTVRRPKCLSAAAVQLVEDTLRKGIVRFFVQQGAWRSTSCLQNEAISKGRLWELHADSAKMFTFSRETMEFLLWLTSGDAYYGRRDAPKPRPLTLGDRLVLALAMHLVREKEIAANWKRKVDFGGDGLIQLLFPSVVADLERPIAFADWLSPQGTFVLHGLQLLLAKQWKAATREAIASLQRPETLTALRCQSATLQRFLSEIDVLERRDLAHFLMLTAKSIFTEELTFAQWTARLTTTSLRLSERTEQYNEAIMLAHHFQTLENWYQESLRIGYLDEGYAQSQWYKGEWEKLELSETAEHAAALRRAADPLG